MPRASSDASAPHGVLGIEAGGTRTTSCWQETPASDCRLATHGPANLQLITDAELLTLFQRIAETHPAPSALGIAMAGARTPADHARIHAAARRVWPGIPVHATHDLEAALAAASVSRRLGVLVLSGTGSCCYGRGPQAQEAKVGGWGHILGDQGSAHALALDALRALILRLDQQGAWGIAGPRLLDALGLPNANALVGWAGKASKREIAGLAPLIFEASAKGDADCRAALHHARLALADAALSCARQLGAHPSGADCEFVLAGSVLIQQPAFAQSVARRLRSRYPECLVVPLVRSGAEGAAALARQLRHQTPPTQPRSRSSRRPAETSPSAPRAIPSAIQPSPTEARHPASMDLDRMPLRKAVRLMIEEDRRLPEALMAVAKPLENATRLVSTALRQGGRLLYVGAGTSGRLGVLDASECPPTFRTPPELIQGILAGGEGAMFRAVEGAEDDYEAGARALRLRTVTSRDVVVGIAASGRTPFVWGALAEARRVHARTVLITLQPHLRFARGTRPTVVIAPDIGAELLTGSTRLKSGTVTKQILNIFTTLAMVSLGKVMGNLMVDLNPSNTKLRDRAVRIVRELTGATESEASEALHAAGWIVRQAIESLRTRAARRPKH